MRDLVPTPKIRKDSVGQRLAFSAIRADSSGLRREHGDLAALLGEMLWNHPALAAADAPALALRLVDELPAESSAPLYRSQGYALEIGEAGAELRFETRSGCVHGLSTLVQLLSREGGAYTLPRTRVVDWPSIEVRGLSTTFAWYAGYGRLGFDMQLWGYEDWARFLHVCADFKVNQLNLCMYGYWPFELPEYPETVLRGFPMDAWNSESRNWVRVEYLHPNLAEPFLPRLIELAHRLDLRLFAYIGLNSYSGGYASEHPERRMRLPAGSKYVNDFDTLCLSEASTIEYLEKATAAVARLGFDGIVFEESEESQWFCDCPKCRAAFFEGAASPAEAKHRANYRLLRDLRGVIKAENPGCVVGLRAWREPPLEKDPAYLRSMVEAIPEDVVLFWAPGLYVPPGEFRKWVDAFGADRIWGHDTESNAVSSCLGRLVRIFRSNGLRCEEETNDQYLEQDIAQHRESLRAGVKGINGYLFEWYGFFLHFFAHAAYGWGCDLAAEDFYPQALAAVFGPESAEDLLRALRSSLVIHESQVDIFPTEFPFARNKVEERDEPRIARAIEDWPAVLGALERVRSRLAAEPGMEPWLPHLDKLIVASRRNRVIYDLAMAAIALRRAEGEAERRRWLVRMRERNREDFAIVRANYFDVNPVSRTGTKSCMIPCHELERVLGNELDSGPRDETPIYLGVEALGWLWL